MSTFYRKAGVRQTWWGPVHEPESTGRWYADICADVTDAQAIEQAKTIVDAAMPQKLSTQYGSHYYSFLQREFLLNQLLFFWKDHGCFPSGWICLVDELTMRPVLDKGWWTFSARRSGREYVQPRWMCIPTLQAARAQREAEQQAAQETADAAARTAQVPRRSYGYSGRWGR